MEKGICKKCQGTTWVLVEKKGKTVARRCDCYVKKQKQVLFQKADIPRRYKNCTLDNFEIHKNNTSHRDALKISRQFVNNFPAQDIGMLFIGPCGVGKTHIAAAIINELIKTKKTFCHFTDFRELIRSIQNTYTPDSSMSESDVLNPVFQCQVLVMDELGAKRATAWVEDTIFYIINNRYNNKKLTIFTSNYLDQEDDEVDARQEFFKQKDDSLIDRIGVRLRSRIYEMCKVVEMWGEDYRKVIKQANYRF